MSDTQKELKWVLPSQLSLFLQLFFLPYLYKLTLSYSPKSHSFSRTLSYASSTEAFCNATGLGAPTLL